jgi:hypothetical protein
VYTAVGFGKYFTNGRAQSKKGWLQFWPKYIFTSIYVYIKDKAIPVTGHEGP